MKIKNQREKQIACAHFQNIEPGMCFYDEYYEAVMMKLSDDKNAVNIATGIITDYESFAYLPLVDAEVMWDFKEEEVK